MKPIIILLVFFCCFTAQSQLEWVYQTGGDYTGAYEQDAARSIFVDDLGYTYICGFFDGNSDFDFGPLTDVLSSNGSVDVFVVKLDPSGQLVWAKSFGGAGFDAGHSIKVDALHNVYICGVFSATVDFDPSSGIMNATSEGSYDSFVVKFDAVGDLAWVRTFGGSSNETCDAIELDDFSNVYVTGSFSSTVDFDLGSGINNITCAGARDAYIVKFDKDGNWKWSNTFGAGNLDSGLAIDVDVDHNIYVTGTFGETVDFEEGPSVSSLTSFSNLDAFVLKIDTLGQHLWSKSFECSSDVYSYGIATDQNSNCYVTGTYHETMDANPSASSALLTSNGDWDIFVIALDSIGEYLWANSFGGDDGWDKSNGICTNSNNDVYVTGYISPMVDFDPGVGTNYLNNTGDDACFVLKLDQFGVYQWAEIVGSELGKGSGMGITTDNLENIYICGSFGGSLEINIGPTSTQLDCIGAQDAFTFKLGNLTSISDKNLSLTLGPNPCHDYLKVNNTHSSSIDLLLINNLGELIRTVLVPPGSSDINMSNFASGLYFVHTREGDATIKIIKQ